MAAAEQNVAWRAECPRCGSTRLEIGTIVYGDGPVPYHLCNECAYLDLQQLPTYISPKTTTKVDPVQRRLPTGVVAPVVRQAGTVDEESATGALPPGQPPR
jgi:hypothetical protein